MTDQLSVSESTESNNVESTDELTLEKKTNNNSQWPLFILMLLVICAASVGGGWLWYMHNVDIKKITESVSNIAKPVASVSKPVLPIVDLSALTHDIEILRQKISANETASNAASSDDAIAALGVQVASMQRQLQAQNDTSRDDWKLAEAEFLLHLANQRILLAHDSKEALALSQTVDDILRDRNDPKLFSVRKILATEILSLENANIVDSEGVYLRLQSLIENVQALTLANPYNQSIASVKDNMPVEVSSDKDTVWSKVSASFSQAKTVLGSYIRVRNHKELPEPLLAPAHAYYLQQNLRLMLEQSQAALLREEAEIFQASLAKADAWIAQYFANNTNAQSVRKQILSLQGVELVVELPDVTEALRLLKIYINELHGVTAVMPTKASLRIAQGAVQ